MNNLRQILQSDQYVVGSWINTASPIVAELMATAGFDFLTVDAEHSAVTLPQVQMLFQAIRAGNAECAALVRLPGSDYATTKQYMDAGATGVIAPLINSKLQAEEVVQAVKYPPRGARGVGYCRANSYGPRLEEEVALANDKTVVCVQIEHIQGVERIDEILSVPDIDAAFIGPYDLSASMGITGEFEHPRMVEARERILNACKKHHVAPGIHVVQPEVDELIHRVKEGYRFIGYSLDITMLTRACYSGLSEIRRRLLNS